MLQEHLHPIHIRPLNGVTTVAKKPQLNYENYVKGKYQRQTENYIKQNFGFRPNLVRFYNQYLWDFYKKTYNTGSVSIGKEGWLYEPWFVEDHYHGLSYDYNKDSTKLAQRFNDESFRLIQLQNILKKYGTTLLVCQLPGKDLIYPEYLPDDTVTTRPKVISARDYYDQKFDELGINHINVENWFLTMKDTADFNLFPQKGTHWSNLAALYVADSIFSYIEQANGIHMNHICIGSPYIDKVRDPDDDLEGMLNLARPMRKLPQQYADYSILRDPNNKKPKVITIGDSFYWNICRQLPMEQFFASNPYWYYNNTIYFDPIHDNVKELDLVKTLMDADVVLLMYCSTQLYKMSNNFSLQAVNQFLYSQEEKDAVKEGVVHDIVSSKEWYASMQKKSEEKQKPIEECIDENADYYIKTHTQKYYPALLDTIPVRRSFHCRDLEQQRSMMLLGRFAKGGLKDNPIYTPIIQLKLLTQNS